jgi:hypothetical protein
MKNPIKLILLLSIMALTTSCATMTWTFMDKVESPDVNHNYCLYVSTNGVVGDPGFRVLKLEKSIHAERVQLDSFKSIVLEDKTKIPLEQVQILYNQELGRGTFTDQAKLELRKSRFLVQSRGGYDMALYDIVLNKALINPTVPSEDFRTFCTNNHLKYSLDTYEYEEAYGKWLKDSIQSKILDYISNTAN